MRISRHLNALGSMIGVFVHFDDVRARLKAAKDADGQADASAPTPPGDQRRRGILALVDESQCEPLAPIDVSEPPILPESP